jgi:hypothetical protein
VNRRCQASSIPVESYDITAVLIRLRERDLVVIACYEARNGEPEAEREADLAERLQAINTATKRSGVNNQSSFNQFKANPFKANQSRLS